jgi:hypothetical protein
MRVRLLGSVHFGLKVEMVEGVEGVEGLRSLRV